MQPHKYAEVIKHWADGGEIQWRQDGADWVTWRGNCAPSFVTTLEWRIKPEPRRGWYRVALFVARDTYWTDMADHWGNATEARIERSMGFSRWLTPRIEYEVEE